MEIPTVVVVKRYTDSGPVAVPRLGQNRCRISVAVPRLGQLIPHRVEIGTEMENVPDEDDSKKSSELVPTSPKRRVLRQHTPRAESPLPNLM